MKGSDVGDDDSDGEWVDHCQDDESVTCDDIVCDSEEDRGETEVNYDSETCDHEKPKVFERDGEKDPNVNFPDPIEEAVQGNKLNIVLWQLFDDYKDFGGFLRDYAIQERFEIVKIKYETTRVTARCKNEKWKWRVHASPLPNGLSFVVKSLNLEHTCLQVTENKLVTSSWITKKLASKLREAPDTSIESMRSWLKDDYGVKVDNLRLWRARNQIRGQSEGHHKESFRKLRWYAEMILQTNPGSLAIVKSYIAPSENLSSSTHIVPTFQRIFICYEAMKNGFLNGCRPFIGVDGYHLKGRYKGVLLSVVAVDGNLNFYLIAYAIAEAENKESWLWFMENLKEAIGETKDGTPWCIMSDRQKGIFDAAHVLPGSFHRYCYYHLKKNFQQKFGELALRKKFREAAETANANTFKNTMECLRGLKKEVFEWLDNIPPQHWSMSSFDHSHKVDHLTNNHTESFNAWVNTLRYKPPIALLEGLREKQVNLMWTRKEKAAKCTTKLTPSVLQRLNKLLQKSRYAVVHRMGEYEFQVDYDEVKCEVRLNDRYCIVGNGKFGECLVSTRVLASCVLEETWRTIVRSISLQKLGEDATRMFVIQFQIKQCGLPSKMLTFYLRLLRTPQESRERLGFVANKKQHPLVRSQVQKGVVIVMFLVIPFVLVKLHLLNRKQEDEGV